MRKTTLRLQLGFLVFLTASSIAAASDDSRSYVSPFWGGALMDAQGGNDLFDELGFESGFQLGARGGYRLSHRVAIEGSYRYSPSGALLLGFEDDLFGRTEFDTDASSHGFSGDVRFFVLGEDRKLQPFVAAGLGVEIFRTGRITENQLLWNLAGGTEWRWRPRLALRGDVRYVRYPDFFLDDKSHGSIELQGGLVVSF